MTISTILDPYYVSLGCWKDQEIRAIDGSEGSLGIEGCYQRAKELGNEFFAVQFHGQCFTSATAGDTYKKYGISNDCPEDGNGGSWCQEVYKISKINILCKDIGTKVDKICSRLG